MSGILDVCLSTEKVGRLWLDEHRHFVFAYDPQWLANDAAIPLSLSLPLRPEPYDDEYARSFFANLLPESDLRRRMARKLGLSEKNDFALLEAVGGECAGAITLLPEGTQPTGGDGYKTLSDGELKTLVADLPKRPMLAGEDGVRLSLAGAQNKLPVLFDGHRISIPLGDAASSHILKPPIRDYPYSVENEYFCMALAARMGLAVPKVTLLHQETSLYLIERYDRRGAPGDRIERVHQEDFCQALGIPPEHKYEKEGGPSLQQCFTLLRDNSTRPVADISALLRWVIFNYMIGNADAHAKNVSLLLTPKGPRLAPFYDLLSTAVYPGLAERLAMKIGGEDRPDWVIERRWRQFAADIGIGFKLIRQELVYMKEAVSDNATALAQAFVAEHGGCEVIGRILEVIEQRGAKITRALTAAE